jgi:hypothetical protein
MMTMMIYTAAQNKASTWCQQASTRKRKTSPALVDKDTNDITKCKNFFKSNEGITLCSDLVSMRMKSGKNLSCKEMAAINSTLQYSVHMVKSLPVINAQLVVMCRGLLLMTYVSKLSRSF